MEQINEYNGVAITFAKKDNSRSVMVNLTEMAKAFPDKNLSHIVNSKEMQEYITELTEIQNCSSADLLIVSKGGNDLSKQGTWGHRLIALRVAQKLSPKFAVWVDDRIEELLTTGVSTINNDDETILNAINILQKRLEESKAKQKELENKVEQDKPKVLFADTVSSSSTSILIGELAKLIAQKGVNIGQNRLFEWLRQKGYLCNRNGNKNYPTQKSIEQGLFEVVERTITKPDGSATSSFTTKVTGKGQIYFVNKILNNR